MLKLSTLGNQRFQQARQLNVEFSGAEANVAVSLANFGMPVAFVTKVPANDLGLTAIHCLRGFGVDTSYVVSGGERLGIYFAEKGASQRASKVIYDRANSAIATAIDSDFDWKKIFEGAEWFHFTGITPALSPQLAAICLEACKNAKAAGLTVSCDLNYRTKLWTREEARKVMTELAAYVDICIANESDIADVFNNKSERNDVEHGIIHSESYQQVAAQLLKKFNFKLVAITLRESLSASNNNWSAVLYDGKEFFNSKKYAIQIVDRIGSGDSFSAGLIYGLTNGFDLQRSLDFAVAASCLKHSIEGDFNLVGTAEVQSLMDNNFSGRIQR